MKVTFTFIIFFYTLAVLAQYNYGVEVEQQDVKIEGKLNLSSGNGNLFIGKNAGVLNTTSDHTINTFIGDESGSNNTTGSGNTMLGYYAGYISNGLDNTIVGALSGLQLTTGTNNTLLGYNSGRHLIDGKNNVLLGSNAGLRVGANWNNTIIGTSAGIDPLIGANNVFIGFTSGHRNKGSDNVFIGYQSGWHETGSNKLYIETASFQDVNNKNPLIYGEFNNDKAGINWDSSIRLPATLSVNGTLHISETAKLEPQMSAPSTCTTAGEYGLIYYDSSSTTHKLKVCTNTGWEDLN